MTARLVVMLFSLSALMTVQAELRDPTRPPGLDMTTAATSQPAAAVKLQAIFFSPAQAAALINGQRVIVGDTVGAARVMRIEPDRVLLQDNEGELELQLVMPTVKSRVMPARGNNNE